MSDIAYHKIAQMYLFGTDEDKDIAYNWLVKLIGEKNAKANLYILTFHKDWDDDSDYKIDDDNYWKMIFKTEPVFFGKNYQYQVTMIAVYQGLEVINTTLTYSRGRVGEGYPKWDFCSMLCQAMMAAGYTFQHDLFTGKKQEHEQNT